MKTAVETVLDATSVLYRLFIAAILYQVNPNIAILVFIFYGINIAFTFYYLHLKAEEDKQFISMVHDAIERSKNKNEETDIE